MNTPTRDEIFDKVFINKDLMAYDSYTVHSEPYINFNQRRSSDHSEIVQVLQKDFESAAKSPEYLISGNITPELEARTTREYFIKDISLPKCLDTQISEKRDKIEYKKIGLSENDPYISVFDLPSLLPMTIPSSGGTLENKLFFPGSDKNNQVTSCASNLSSYNFSSLKNNDIVSYPKFSRGLPETPELLPENCSNSKRILYPKKERLENKKCCTFYSNLLTSFLNSEKVIYIIHECHIHPSTPISAKDFFSCSSVYSRSFRPRHSVFFEYLNTKILVNSDFKSCSLAKKSYWYSSEGFKKLFFNPPFPVYSCENACLSSMCSYLPKRFSKLRRKSPQFSSLLPSNSASEVNGPLDNFRKNSPVFPYSVSRSHAISNNFYEKKKKRTSLLFHVPVKRLRRSDNDSNTNNSLLFIPHKEKVSYNNYKNGFIKKRGASHEEHKFDHQIISKTKSKPPVKKIIDGKILSLEGKKSFPVKCESSCIFHESIKSKKANKLIDSLKKSLDRNGLHMFDLPTYQP